MDNTFNCGVVVRRNWWLITLAVCFASGMLYAQHASTDSLENRLKNSPPDSSRVLLLCELSNKYLTYRPSLSRKYAEEALTLSQQLHFKNGEILALNRLGEFEFRQSNYAHAVEFSTRSLKLAEESHDSLAMAAVYRVLGNINTFGFKQYDKALKYQLLALSIYEKEKDMRSIASSYGNVTWIYANTNQNLTEALRLAKRGAHIADSLDNEQLLSYNYNSLGLIFRSLGNLDSALYYLDKSTEAGARIMDRGVISYNNSIKGSIYLLKKDFKKAQESFSLAERVSRELNSREVLKESFRGLAQTYEALGNYTLAFQYQKKFSELNDSLVNREITQKSLMMEYELNEQRREIKIAELEQSALQARREKEIYTGLLSTGITSLLIIIILIVRNNRQKRKANEILLEKNEEIARQNLKLIQTNEVKDKLFFIIGHDLRGPLSGLKSLLGMVARNELSHEEFKHIAPLLNQNVIGLSETMDNLLLWSGSQLHGWQHDPVDFNFHPLVEKVFTLFAELAHRKNISMSNEVSRDLRVHADKNQMELVTRNLLHNAIKFTPDGGHIQVCSGISGNFAEISISDTGIGIDEVKLATLFADAGLRNTRGTNGEQGTGLGLTLCKEMVNTNGGRITVTSKPGSGTTFHVFLKSAQKEIIVKERSSANGGR